MVLGKCSGCKENDASKPVVNPEIDPITKRSRRSQEVALLGQGFVCHGTNCMPCNRSPVPRCALGAQRGLFSGTGFGKSNTSFMLSRQANMEKLRRENNSLKTELAMEFRQFRKPVDSSSADRIAQVRSNTRRKDGHEIYFSSCCTRSTRTLVRKA